MITQEKNQINVNKNFKGSVVLSVICGESIVITNRKTKRNIPNSVFYLLKKMYMTVFMLQCVISIAYSYGKIYQLFIFFFIKMVLLLLSIYFCLSPFSIFFLPPFIQMYVRLSSCFRIRVPDTKITLFRK